MIGSGKNKKSMGYVLNIAQFLTAIIDHPPGVHVYNFADKPDITAEELITVGASENPRKKGYSSTDSILDWSDRRSLF